MFEQPEDAEHLSKDLTVVYDNRIHGVIFRLQSDMSVLFIEGFNGSGIINQRYHGVPVGSRLAAIYKNLVPAENADINHGVTLYLQHKGLAAWHHVRRDWKIVLNILLR